MPDEKTETKPIDGGEVTRTTKEFKDGNTQGVSVTETVEKTVTEKKG